MSLNEVAIRSRIQEAVQIEMDLSEAVAQEVAFHMTDWLSELEVFHRFCQSPGALSIEEVSNLLMDFLVHAPNHIAAAGKLVTGIPVADIFKVGAVSHDGKS